jgi:isopenicillin-N N-acyltransferase like protein
MPPQLLIGVSRKARLRRILRRLGFASGAVALCLLLSYTAFRRWTLMTAPKDDTDEGPLPQAAEVEFQGQEARLRVGESWMERRDGVWRLDLRGSPRMMGHAHGLLASSVTARIERHMEQLMQSYVTSSWRRWAVENAVRWRFRTLPENLPPARLVELSAYSRTMPDASELPGSPFQRLVYYHALHDMTQRLDGSPLVGCTAFAVWGSQTVNGHLLVGRNFDFEGGDIFDEDKAVLAFHTPGKHAFVSVAWPGMMGVVTGVNDQRLYVSINAARVDDPFQPGIPMAFLVREILESCSTVKEAIALIKTNQVMVPDALLIADGKVPEAVVVELAPRSLAVRRGPSGTLGVANHFLDNSFRSDASNDWLRRYMTSDARYRRVTQLLKRFSGRFDPRTAAMVLRNRTGIDDEPLGLGNRNALDALIATHGVVADLTDMVLWVSRGPHLLGPFVAIDLKPLFGIPLARMDPPEAIPADVLLDSPELRRYQMAQADMKLARELNASKSFVAALDHAHRASLLAPDSHEAQKLMGDLLWQAGRREDAKAYYRTFLKLHPPYLKEKEEVTARLDR